MGLGRAMKGKIGSEEAAVVLDKAVPSIVQVSREGSVEVCVDEEQFERSCVVACCMCRTREEVRGRRSYDRDGAGMYVQCSTPEGEVRVIAIPRPYESKLGEQEGGVLRAVVPEYASYAMCRCNSMLLYSYMKRYVCTE